MTDKDRINAVRLILQLYEEGHPEGRIESAVAELYRNMTPGFVRLLTKESLGMFGSLVESIDRAGGSIPFKEIIEMSVLQLISTLCTNGVRFTYERKEERLDR